MLMGRSESAMVTRTSTACANSTRPRGPLTRRFAERRDFRFSVKKCKLHAFFTCSSLWGGQRPGLLTSLSKTHG